MKLLIQVICFFLFVSSGFSQRIGFGISSGIGFNSYSFSQLFTTQDNFNTFSYNQLYYNYNSVGGYLFYSDDKRIKNELGMSSLISWDANISSSNTVLTAFNTYTVPHLYLSYPAIKQGILSNKFSIKIIKTRILSLSSHIKIGYQFLLKKRMNQLNFKIQQISDDSFSVSTLNQFIESQSLKVKNFFSFDYGFDLNYKNINLGVSHGFNISDLGQTTVLGRLTRIEASLSYTITSRPVNFKLNKKGNTKSSVSKLSSKLNSLYLRIIQPIFYAMPLRNMGIYGSNFLIDNNFGFTDVFIEDQYVIFNLQENPKFSLFPGMAIGFKFETNSRFFTTYEVGGIVKNIKFGTVYYNSDSYNNYQVTVTNSKNKLDVLTLNTFINAKVNHRLLIGKRFNITAGSGFAFDFNYLLFQVSSPLYANLMFSDQKNVLYPGIFNGSFLSSVGIESRLISLDLNYSIGLLNYFPTSVSIGLKKLQNFSVSLKLPLFKFNQR